MKHPTFSMLAALGCLLALAGCSAAPAAPADSGAFAASPSPAASAAPTQPPAGLAEVNAMGPNAYHLAYTAPGGTGWVASAIGLEDGVQRVLCSQPGCTHTDAGCPAWLCPAEWGHVPQARAVGDTVYWLTQQQQDGPARILAWGPEAQSPAVLYEGALPLSGLLDCFCAAEGEHLYFFGLDWSRELSAGAARCYRLCSLDGRTGQVTQISALAQEQNAFYTCLGVWQGQLVLQEDRARDGQTPGWDSRFLLYGPDGQPGRELFACSAASLPLACLGQSSLFLLTGDWHTPLLLFLEDGQTRQAEGLPLSPEGIVTAVQAAGDAFLVSYFSPQNDQNLQLALSPDTGQYTPLYGSYYDSGFFPPTLLGQQNGLLLASLGWVDGAPLLGRMPTSRRLAGGADWALCTLLPQPEPDRTGPYDSIS